MTISASDVTTGTKTVNVSLDKICAVSFTLTPSGATLVVKDNGVAVTPVEGVYNLKAGSYTYDASAEGYTSVTGESFTVSSEDVTTGTKTIVVTLTESAGNQFTIVNNSSNDVEIYYEDDKEEKGNTTVQAGATVRVTIDAQYPYYIRYESGGSTNSHNFNGTYGGSSVNTTVGYYDGNIQPPEATGSATEWSFTSGDGGTLTISNE